MLVLSRKVGERIVIGPNVVVTVVAVHGARVKLSIEAPSEVSIHREEIGHRIAQQEKGWAIPVQHDKSQNYAEFA